MMRMSRVVIYMAVGLPAQLSPVMAQPPPPMPGKLLYEQSCLVCHGEDGTGAMPGVADLTDDDRLKKLTDSQIEHSIRNGVQREGAVLTMPAKGGNPAMSDEDISRIIKFMKKTFK